MKCAAPGAPDAPREVPVIIGGACESFPEGMLVSSEALESRVAILDAAFSNLKPSSGSFLIISKGKVILEYQKIYRKIMIDKSSCELVKLNNGIFTPSCRFEAAESRILIEIQGTVCVTVSGEAKNIPPYKKRSSNISNAQTDVYQARIYFGSYIQRGQIPS